MDSLSTAGNLTEFLEESLAIRDLFEKVGFRSLVVVIDSSVRHSGNDLCFVNGHNKTKTGFNT
jgi:hypothetical protein